MAGQQMIGGTIGSGFGMGIQEDPILAQMRYANMSRGGVGGGSAGEMWNHALSGVGENIARAMQMYHAQHLQYNQQMGLANALSRIGISKTGQLVSTVDAQGKPVKDVQPIIDSKALDQFNTSSHAGQMQAVGALNALNRLGMQTVQQGMRYAAAANAPQTPLQQATTQRAQAQTKLIAARTNAILNPTGAVKPPTAAALMQNQQAQIRTLLNQKDKIDKQQTLQSMQFSPLIQNPITVNGKLISDPSALINYNDNDPSHVIFGHQPTIGQFQEKTDDNNVPETHAQIPGGAADGTDLTMPIQQWKTLANKAEQIKALGQQSQAIGDNVANMQKQAQQFNQLWSAQPPQIQQNIFNNLTANPSPENKGNFDKQVGIPGAADLLLKSGAGQQQASAQPSATPAPDANETDTGGEQQANAAPPQDESDTEPPPAQETSDDTP